MLWFLKAAYAPAFMFGFIGAGLALVTRGQSLAWLAPLLGAAIAVSFFVERVIPYEPIWNRPRGDSRRDVLHALVNEASVYAGAALIPVLTLLSPAAGLWPAAWPIWAQLVLAILLADLGITLCHYFSHKFQWLWRFHAVHHSVKRMYGFNGLMKHPVHQAVETLAGTAPLILMGMPLQIGVLLGFAVAIQLLLQHANVDMRLGPLCYVMAWAPVHRFHHQKGPGVGDVNFGLFTCLWDYLLRTAYYDHSKRLSSDDIGIGDQPNYPTDYVAQLAAPFRKIS
ncbi:MAG: sterol desaturase family protein [Phenylobacterium sp.]|uniref:sterol desaturase family protein n=1 Tax=unclassified Phenylobacterium TaxID=2640670 RepID=UPI000868440F|nr:sterol desaturase family protein [Phenylobacterium sp. SCN 70-31]ODT86067.1 MAG: fatty acid hydroxylase [Phenylobacterium sp. SCN 70-31]